MRKEHLLPSYRRLIREAKQVRRRAYAPYSKYRVGAAVLTSKGRIFAGCNVENGSYGLTLCAERSAVAQAVSAGEKRIIAVAVVADGLNGISPCGACRQVISEFGKEAVVIMSNLKGQLSIKNISSLLPHRFDGSRLPR